jgi:serine/threonine protein kinase
MALSFRTSGISSTLSEDELGGQASISTTALDFVSALATSRFELLASSALNINHLTFRLAGRGGYATIEIGTISWPHERLVAVKRSLVQSEPQANAPKDSKKVLGKGFEHIVRELRILGHEQLRKHGNIINLEGVCLDDFNGLPSLALVMEYSELGTLRAFLIENAETFSPDERINFVLQAGRGLEALHHLRVCHADVKIDNALVFKSLSEKNGISSWVVKISDFGQSVIASRDDPDGRVPCRPGTHLLEAPEIRRGQAFQDPCFNIQAALQTDVFSFGLFGWEVMKNGQGYVDMAWLELSGQQMDVDIVENFLNNMPDDSLFCYAADFARGFDDKSVVQVLLSFFEGALRDQPQSRRTMSELMVTLALQDKEYVVYSSFRGGGAFTTKTAC